MAAGIDGERAREVVRRLDEASGALCDAREICDEIGEDAEEERHDSSMAMEIIQEVAVVIEDHAEPGGVPPGAPKAPTGAASEEDPVTGWPLWRRRLLEAGARGDLRFAVSFEGEYVRFYDADAGPPASEEAEIVYWDKTELAEQPGLLAGVLERVAENRARVVYERAYGEAA